MNDETNTCAPPPGTRRWAQVTATELGDLLRADQPAEVAAWDPATRLLTVYFAEPGGAPREDDGIPPYYEHLIRRSRRTMGDEERDGVRLTIEVTDHEAGSLTAAKAASALLADAVQSIRDYLADVAVPEAIAATVAETAARQELDAARRRYERFQTHPGSLTEISEAERDIKAAHEAYRAASLRVVQSR